MSILFVVVGIEEMIGFCPLASGSKGNCLFLGTSQTKILVDAGLSGRAIIERLGEIGVDPGDIDAILVSHEHTDHIQGLKVLGCRMGIPVLANHETAKGIIARIGDRCHFKIFSTGESFEFEDLMVHPFSVQHDAADPVAFTVKTMGYKLGICTDLGFVTSLVRSQLQGCDYLYVEANHQPALVAASSRPAANKQRVLGRSGHLSNEACGKLLADVVTSEVKQVFLAHLSDECNAPDVAQQEVLEQMQGVPYLPPVSIAWQDRVSEPIYFNP